MMRLLLLRVPSMSTLHKYLLVALPSLQVSVPRLYTLPYCSQSPTEMPPIYVKLTPYDRRFCCSYSITLLQTYVLPAPAQCTEERVRL